KANRNSSPTYSLVRFAPSHFLRMGDFFQKAVKKLRRLIFIPLPVLHSLQHGSAPGTPTMPGGKCGMDIFEEELLLFLV
ncbi:hypothetical protein, partial [Heyndrickxia coagulans]|uniref:hypothetical protein n=1 Tax=Heyndrickxia coagulans TaxID=1398 RepID=UPI00128F6946